MKKISIATYCEWNSYGSVLQALALKKYLSKMECNVSLLRLKSISATRLKLYFSGKSLKNGIINFHRFIIKKQLERRYRETMDFFKNNFEFQCYSDYSELCATPPQADLFIAGSDQIWNPKNDLPFFYLDFVKEPEKKISYAASMGSLKVPEGKLTQWLTQIEMFGRVSVREAAVKEFIQDHLSKDVAVHIDPTFLIEKEEWKKEERQYPIKKPYILVYALYWDKKYNKDLKRLHKETGLPIVTITSQLQNVYAQRRISNATVQEFLWLIDNAEYVVTSSFHGVAFSIIFQKSFSAIVNPNSSSRICGILKTLGIANPPIAELNKMPKQNYDYINMLIEKERIKSYQYLYGAIYEK